MNMSSTQQDHLLTTRETAKLLHLTKPTLSRMRKNESTPALPFMRFGKQAYRYRFSDVKKYMSACTVDWLR
jgi:excisionase family DNA binding protein